MSELTTTTNGNNSTSWDDVSQRYHHLLLFLEASMASLFFASLLTLLCGFHIYSPLTDFCIIAGLSVIALAFGVRAAARHNTRCIVFWRVVFHGPFLIEIFNASSELPRLGEITAFSLIAAAVDGPLELLYQNMTSSAGMDSDGRAGLILLDDICRWVQQMMIDRRHRVASGSSSLSGSHGVPLRLPHMARTDDTRYTQVPTDERDLKLLDLA